MMPSGTVVIFIEFPIMHWHFNPVLNGSVMTARAAMKVYIFRNYQFCVSIMSLFFRLHEPYDDIALDDVHPPFHPLMYPTDKETDSDTGLTSTYSVESDPSEPSYPSMICLSLDSSSSTTSQAPPSVCGHGFIHT